MVFVVSKSGKPLMPTIRYRHVRKLLEEKKAVPISNLPFTIKLKYDTPEIIQELYLGIDPGRENIGIGVSKENGECIFLSELQTSNRSIKKNMEKRKSFRIARRRNRRLRKQRKAIKTDNQFSKPETKIKTDKLRTTKNCVSKEYLHPGMKKPVIHKCIKGKEPRFQNRHRPEEWLSPSARQLIQMHFRAIESIMEFLPISHIILERNVFNFQKLENQDIKNWQYSKGPLYGFSSYKDYINDQQKGRCLLCGCNGIDNYHHIRPKYKGGSDSIFNIAGLCDDCHNGINGVHKNRQVAEKLEVIKKGMAKKYKISLLNTIMPFLIEQLTIFCGGNDIFFSLTDGYATFIKRNELDMDKKHCIDGYVISISNRETLNNNIPEYVYNQRRFKKKSSNNIQKLNRREYYLNIDGKNVLVAVNRNKAEDQTENSLAEYKQQYLKDHTTAELTGHLMRLIVKPAKRTYTAHKYGLSSNIHVGDIVKYEKKNKIKGNIKMLIFLTTGVSILAKKIEHGTKSKKIDYCKSLRRGAINFTDKASIA